MIFRLKNLWWFLVPLLLVFAYLGLPWTYASDAQLLQALQVHPKESETAKIIDLVRLQLAEPWLFTGSLGHSLTDFPHTVASRITESFLQTAVWTLGIMLLGFVGSAALGWALFSRRWYPHSFLIHWVRVPPVLWVVLFSFVTLRGLEWIGFFAYMSFFLGGLLQSFDWEKSQPYAQFARQLGMGNQWLVQPIVKMFIQSYRIKWPWLWTHAILIILVVELLQQKGTGYGLYQSLVGMDFALHRVLIPLLLLVSLIPLLAKNQMVSLHRNEKYHWKRALLLSALMTFGGLLNVSNLNGWVIVFFAVLPWVLLLPRRVGHPMGLAWVLPIWFFWPLTSIYPEWNILGLLLLIPFQGLSIVLSLFLFQCFFTMSGSIPFLYIGASMALVLLIPQEDVP